MKTKEKKIDINKIVYIEWVDAYQDSDSGWKTKEDIMNWLDKWGDFVIKQCGWIIVDNKEYLVIASEKHEGGADNDTPQYSLLQKIPRTWIRKIVNI